MTVRRSRAPAAEPTATAATIATYSMVAGTAVVLASTALAGVLSGSEWFADVLLAVLVVVAAGTGLRTLRAPRVLVGLGQLAALAGLVTVTFTHHGVFAVVPGPDALRELEQLLRGAVEQVRVGVAPVATTVELRCMVMIALGLVAVAVDSLSVSAAPATSGLVLLCVIAVPALLADELLPWWSFAAGALGFALLLARAALSGTAVVLALLGLPAAAAGVVVALLVGVTATGVGTEARLPGSADGATGPSSGIGVNAFTSLRGQLQRDEPIDLFRVHGLAEPTYLRALTLSEFDNGRGWFAGPMEDPVRADGPVPLPAGADSLTGRLVSVRIEPINYVDNWLPTVGIPRGFRGAAAGWSYDQETLTAFSEDPRRAGAYTVRALLPAADPAALRASDDPAGGLPRRVRERFVDTGGLDPRVSRLAEQVTAGADSAFAAAVALTRFFTEPSNGFRYSLQTVPGSSGDALVDFLLESRTGYCEQYASAMAIMLRSLGIPARVAVGFTPGTDTGAFRLITTDDAHAWVEAWFPGAGWLPFDPTPPVGGRAVIPPYLPSDSPSTGAPAIPDGALTPPTAAPSPRRADTAARSTAPADPPESAGRWPIGITSIVLGTLVLGGLVGLIPRAVRGALRRSRLRRATGVGAAAATAAWEELLAEAADRGTDIPVTQTVREGADQLVVELALDRRTQERLHDLVDLVERAWYGTDGVPGHRLAAVLTEARTELHRCVPLSRRTRLLPRSTLPLRTRGIHRPAAVRRS